MIIVHGTIPIRADVRDQALKLMRWMETESRAEEGCITYSFFVGLSDPNTLLLFQEWEDAEALAEHFNTRHMERFLARLPTVLDGEVSTRRYAVEVRSADDEDGEDGEGAENGDGDVRDTATDPASGGNKPIIH